MLDKIRKFSLSGKQIKNFTGLSWENLFEIKDLITLLSNCQSRLVIQALIVFHFKLRTGNSNKLLASILNIDNEQSFSEYSKSIIQSFEKDVLPLRFGLNSINRDNLIQNHTTEISEKLFDVQDNLLLIYMMVRMRVIREVQVMSIKENLSLDKIKFLFLCTSLFVRLMDT